MDDIEDREVANNPRRVRQRGEKILSDLGGAFSKNRARLVVCNNYITHTGVIRYLLNKIGDSPYTDVYKVSITDDKGAPTWSQRYTKEDIAVQRNKTDYYSWMREFMNTPIEEGKIFRQTWLHYAPIPPLSEMDGLVAYGDLSYKEAGDYKAMVLAGKKGRNFYIISAFVRQTTRARLSEWLYDLYEALQLQNYHVGYFIEGLFAQDEFSSDFDAEGDRRGYYIPVIADKKTKQGKYERIEGMVGFFERGNIFINESERGHPDMKCLVEQLLAFEKGGTAHDDGPDALQSALAELNRYTLRDNWNDIKMSRPEDYNIHSKHRF